MEMTKKPEKSEGMAKTEMPVGTEKPERTVKSDKSARTERTDKTEKSEMRKSVAAGGKPSSRRRVDRIVDVGTGKSANETLPSERGVLPDDRLLLLVDGACAMCRGVTRFAAKRDRADRLRFAALDSATGRETKSRLGIALPPGGSFVLIGGDAAWTRSEAAVRTLAALDPPWPVVGAALRLVPAKLRDAAYDAIAARRHRFARRSAAASCPAAPDERIRRRLLDTEGWDALGARASLRSPMHAARIGEDAAPDGGESPEGGGTL